jgi:hypothetical protein
VGVNCSNCDCSARDCSTLLAGNQLLDTNFDNCSNPVNPGKSSIFFIYKWSIILSAVHVNDLTYFTLNNFF